MIRKLIEASYFQNKDNITKELLEFWLLEMRTPLILEELIKQNLSVVDTLKEKRALLKLALNSNEKFDSILIEEELIKEEKHERELDKVYWTPLIKELEVLRRK